MGTATQSVTATVTGSCSPTPTPTVSFTPSQTQTSTATGGVLGWVVRYGLGTNWRDEFFLLSRFPKSEFCHKIFMQFLSWRNVPFKLQQRKINEMVSSGCGEQTCFLDEPLMPDIIYVKDFFHSISWCVSISSGVLPVTFGGGVGSFPPPK